MPTTFNVISLGQQAIIDPSEGNFNAENAAALVGLTFGGPGDSLVDDFQELTPDNFSGGGGNFYDMNNSNATDTFSIDGGAPQNFDGLAVYNATVTYSDGSTATITAVVFQDDSGNTYLAPEFSANADQAALEAGAIQSITLDSVARANNISGLSANREGWDFVTCFVMGAKILTPDGEVAIEQLKVGDLVETRDKGAQAIRWIGRSKRNATAGLIPVRITAGALGQGVPKKDLLVSQQHRMLVRSAIAQRVAGSDEVLIAAKKLLSLPGVILAEEFDEVTYFHILLDGHEIIFAEGAETESFYLGAMALSALDQDALSELHAIFPDMVSESLMPARSIAAGPDARALIERHKKSGKSLLSH